MAPAQALALVRGFALSGRIVVTRHAFDRMRQRNVTFRDISSALSAAGRCEVAGANWKATGPDVDGDSLTLIVAIEDGLVVVTVF